EIREAAIGDRQDGDGGAGGDGGPPAGPIGTPEGDEAADREGEPEAGGGEDEALKLRRNDRRPHLRRVPDQRQMPDREQRRDEEGRQHRIGVYFLPDAGDPSE